MLKNYLKVALRNLFKHPWHTALSILGLAIGITCAWLSGLYVWDQYQYDRFHKNGDRIYKMVREITNTNGTYFHPGTHPIAPVIADEIAGVESATRVFLRAASVTHNGDGVEVPVCIADPQMLEMFDFPTLFGAGSALLHEPSTALITTQLARKLFGNEDAIGKLVRVNNKMINNEYRVVGIFKDMPRRSTLKFDLISSTFKGNGRALREVWQEWPNKTRTYALQTYVLLQNGVNAQAVERQLQNLAARHNAIEVRHTVAYKLQPLSRIHMYSGVDYGWRNETFKRCWTIVLIGMLVLVIACFNTVTFTTVRASSRARELGLRKIVGATRLQLSWQSFLESIVLACFSAVLAGGLIEFILPVFNNLAASDLTVWDQGATVFLCGIVGIVFFVGILAGSYPALVMPRLPPIQALHNTRNVGSKRAAVRTSLVVIQFCISTTLLIVTAVVYQQINYIQNKDLGFTHEQVVILQLFKRDMSLNRQRDAIRQVFGQTPGVIAVTSVIHRPGTSNDRGGYIVEPKDRPGESVHLFFNSADEGFLETFEIKHLEGETLAGKPARYQAGENTFLRPVMVSTTAARALGWDNPIGKVFHPRGMGSARIVVGTFDDFHDQTLFYPQSGLVLEKGGGPYLAVRIQPHNVSETLEGLARAWKQFLPNHPFEFEFLDETIAQRYREEINFSHICVFFSGLSVFLACLGVIGLMSYTAQQRTRELGIRKALGATTWQVLSLLSRDYLKLAVIASCIATPLGYYLVRLWLDAFAYRIAINPLVFAGSVAILFIALCFSVSGVGLRASKVNPVEALRHE